MLDPLGQRWQNGSALAAYTPDRVAVNKHCLSGSLLFINFKTHLRTDSLISPISKVSKVSEILENFYKTFYCFIFNY